MKAINCLFLLTAIILVGCSSDNYIIIPSTSNSTNGTAGPPGPQGPAGPQGPPGNNGTDGNNFTYSTYFDQFLNTSNNVEFNELNTSQICLNADCKTSWPGGDNYYDNITYLQESNTTTNERVNLVTSRIQSILFTDAITITNIPNATTLISGNYRPMWNFDNYTEISFSFYRTVGATATSRATLYYNDTTCTGTFRNTTLSIPIDAAWVRTNWTEIPSFLKNNPNNEGFNCYQWYVGGGDGVADPQLRSWYIHLR